MKLKILIMLAFIAFNFLYSQKGYRDARILNDSIYVNNDDRLMQIN